jgi:hypothetical protein
VKKQLIKSLGAIALIFGSTAPLHAEGEVDMGMDVFNRYVWRGTDFGDAVSAQPWVSYANGPIEIGAWSSWGITSNGANENDLYISYAAGPVGITLTDYFFPGFTGADDFFNYSDGDGIHILEISASVDLHDMPISLMAAFNFLGDSEDSFYLEASYDLGEIEEVGVSLSAGVGNGVYTTDTDPDLVNVSLSLSKGDYSAAYILNPDQETTFLVFGKSF